MIAGIDTTTFGYVTIFAALIRYLMLGSYRGRAGAMLRDIIIWLALGLGVVMLYYLQGHSLDCGACFALACPERSRFKPVQGWTHSRRAAGWA